MALQLTQNHMGVFCNYWKIISYTGNILEGITHVKLGLFVNETIRNENVENSIIKESHIVQGGDLHLDEIYPKLKEDIPYENPRAGEEGQEDILYKESKFKNATDV